MRATPRVNCDVRRFGRVALCWRTVDWIGREEELHTLHVPGRCAVAVVHVPATDPFCPRRHPDLVTHAVIADRGAEGVATVEEIVARERRIVSARIATAVMDGIMPVVIVIGVHAIPASIVRLKRVMRPAITRICAGNHDILAGESQRPYLWGVGVIDSWFDCGRYLRRRLFRSGQVEEGHCG